jgi:hypothetical protein
VAAGQVNDVTEKMGEIGIWTSPDGLAWQRVEIPSVGDARIVSVVGDGARVVVTFTDAQGNLGLIVGDGASTP